MQVDVKPFDDIRVRRAVVKAADNAAIKGWCSASTAGREQLSRRPVHPEYFPAAGGARCRRREAALKEAGYDKGSI
jgi:hypothetical protein